MLLCTSTSNTQVHARCHAHPLWRKEHPDFCSQKREKRGRAVTKATFPSSSCFQTCHRVSCVTSRGRTTKKGGLWAVRVCVCECVEGARKECTLPTAAAALCLLMTATAASQQLQQRRRRCWRACSLPHVSGVRCVAHDGDPPLEGGHLEEGDVGVANMVERDAAVDPLGVVLRQAGSHVRDDLSAHSLSRADLHTLLVRFFFFSGWLSWC